MRIITLRFEVSGKNCFSIERVKHIYDEMLKKQALVRFLPRPAFTFQWSNLVIQIDSYLQICSLDPGKGSFSLCFWWGFHILVCLCHVLVPVFFVQIERYNAIPLLFQSEIQIVLILLVSETILYIRKERC